MLLAAVWLASGPAFGAAASAPSAPPADAGGVLIGDIIAETRGEGMIKPSDQIAAGARQKAAIDAALQTAPALDGAFAPAIGPAAAFGIGPGDTPDYFTTPNWANSPPLRKFVDPFPGLWDPRGGGVAPAKCVPLAVPDTVTFPGSDYYEIELRQYQEQMHADLPPTTLRGYVQVNLGTDALGANTVVPAPIRYLGPVIVAQKDRPVRVKFVNALLPGPDGKLFVPVDTTVMGSGPYEINFDPETMVPFDPAAPLLTGDFAENRATLHLHGGRTPWISDGTPHQWITPAGEPGSYTKGVSVEYVPDMWFDAAGTLIPGCAGASTCLMTGASTNPGPGAQTFYWTNQQSARLMFYHDHAWGITRLNVYVGGAAGYLITDAAEQGLVASGLIPADQIPLIIQDKTFVDPATITATDPTWAWGSQPWTGVPGDPMTPVAGDLWWPHVYMPAQNPFNPDMSGINPMGRWHYGPWFWPPTPLCFDKGGTDPKAVKPYCVDVAAVPNPYYDPTCDPAIAGFCQPPEIPGTPSVSWGAEAFLDTMVVNGAAYPTLTVDPKQYRLRVLNAAHDRFLNLQFYQAVSKVGYTNPTVAPYDFVGTAPTDLTEVAMVPAAPNGAYPPLWPADGREGGVPDPDTRGPAMIQIGTEGGFLPAPALLPNQPVSWNLDPTMFNVGNVLQQPEGGGTLILGPAERGDVIVDFSNFAGKTLILYNDAPTAFPALVPQYDYYTGAPDRTDIGGIAAVPPGLGPNIRTVMQIRVTGTGGTAPVDDYDPATLANLEAAFASTGSVAGGDFAPGVFAASQDPVLVGQAAYNSTYNAAFPATWPEWGVSRISDNTLTFKSVNPDGSVSAPTTVQMKPKAIHDEMGGTFDDYGRMSAKLGLEVPFSNAAISTFALQNFVDPPTEFLAGEELQVWKVTHNGVDTHPIHFHLYDVQVINRVGWDGFIRLPDPNERGWKDTVRMAPLEDTIVALRPKLPVVPFPVPDSVRPLNPEAPLGSMMGFSQVDPATGGPLAIKTMNELFNFGWEYVWHCHILSHEENDMMRSMVAVVPPDAPSNLLAVSAGGGIDLSWTDNAASETGFTVERSAAPDFAAVAATFDVGASAPATAWNVTIPYTDAAGTASDWYRVRSYGPNGVSAWSNVATAANVAIAQVAPASLAFPDVAVPGTSAPQVVTLSNAGTALLTIGAVGVAGSNPGDFQLTNTCGASLAPGASCTMSVTFTPAQVGARSGVLSIASNSAYGTILVGMTGTGIGPVAALTPGLLAFGDQFQGIASAAQTATLSNTGNAPLLVTSLGMTGANPGDFANSACGPSIAAGTSCTISVTFTPTLTGARSASLTLASDDPLRPTLSVVLTGNGVLPVAGIAPTFLSFASQLVNTTSAAQNVTLSNTGTSQLSSIVVALTGGNAAHYGLANGCGATLAAGATCTIGLTFAPTTAGALPATLTVTSNDPFHSPLTVALVGTGIAPIAGVAPTSLAFGDQLLNTTSAAQSVTLSNTGTADLTGITVALAGASPAHYALSNGCGASLTPGAACTIGVSFAPTVMGDLPAVLSIGGSDPLHPTLTVALSGRGILPIAGVAPSALAFGTLQVGSSASLGVIVSNTGNTALTSLAFAIFGTTAGDFSYTTDCGATLAAGASCTTVVVFAPAAAGARSATLSVNSSDPVNPTLPVTLGGTAIAPIAGISTAALTFGSQLTFLSSAPQALTISNTGNAPLTVTDIAIGGTAAAEFGQTNTCGALPATVAAGASCDVSVVFSPRALGVRSATLTVSSNDRVNPALTATLDGTGIDVKPAAASNLTAVAAPLSASKPQVALSWTDNSYNEVGFLVQRARVATFNQNIVTFTLPANATSYTDVNAAEASTYFYRVIPFSLVGNAPFSNVASATTPGRLPATPTNLALVTATRIWASLTWTDNADNETGYRVQRAPSATGPWSNLATLGANATAYTATGLTAGTTYYFRIRAYNTYGNSVISNVLAVTTRQ